MTDNRSMTLLDDHADHYGLTQLVFVNSGSNAYTKLPLERSLGLTMANNGGKSANLRGLKLILFPEINFQNGQIKFSFVAADGKAYSNEESYKFYFPSSKSFIVGEILNPHQGGRKYCQVLTRHPSNNLGYQRWFVPAPFEEIEHLFFDTQSDANHGLGKPTLIDEKALGTKLKNLGARLISNRKDLMRMMFSVYSPGNPDTFYSLFPLSEEPSEEHVESFKSLIHLAFTMKAADGEVTGKAVSTILSRLVSGDAKFKVDIGKIPEEAQELLVEKLKLTNLKNLAPEWSDTEKVWRRTKSQVAEVEQIYAALKVSFGLHNEGQEEVLDHANEAFQTIDDQYRKAKKKAEALDDQKKSEAGGLKVLMKELEEITEKVEQARDIRASFRPMEIYDDIKIAHHIKTNEDEGIDQLEALVASLRDQSKLAEELSADNRKRSQIDQEVKDCEKQIQDLKQNIMARLDVQSASVMTSLMPDLKFRVAALSDEHVTTIEAFTRLFHVKSEANTNTLHFLDQALSGIQYLSWDKETVVLLLKDKLDKARDRRLKCENRMHYLKGLIGQKIDPEEQLRRIQAKMKEAKEEYNLIVNAKGNEERLQDLQAKVTDKAESIEVLTKEHAKVEDTLNGMLSEHQRAKDERDAAIQAKDDLKNASVAISVVKNQLYKLIGKDPDSLPVADDAEIYGASQLTRTANGMRSKLETILENLDEVRKGLERYKLKTNESLSDYIPESIIDATLPQLLAALSAVSYVFSNLDEQLNRHYDRVIAHNHETSAQITVIRDIILQVGKFEAELNQQLKGIQISDLEDIKVEIVKKNLFTDLAADLEAQIDTADPELLQSNAFYERIQAFSDQVLAKTTGNVNMENIIDSVSWQFKKRGEEKKSSQSTGTQGLLNAMLMMLLLKNMMNENVTVKLPIIFDEAGSLDGYNFSTLKDAAEARGFILLVAAPEVTGRLISELPVISLGLWEMDTVPASLRNCTVVYNQAAERMTEVSINESMLA